MPFPEILRTRRTVRLYQQKEIPYKELEECGERIWHMKRGINNLILQSLRDMPDIAIGETPTVPWVVLDGYNLKRYPDTNDISLRVQDKLGATHIATSSPT